MKINHVLLNYIKLLQLILQYIVIEQIKSKHVAEANKNNENELFKG